MPILTSALSFLAISQLLFLSIVLLVNYRHQVLAQLLVLFSLCMSGYLLLVTTLFDGNVFAVQMLYLLAVSTPAVLWVLAMLLFVDNSRLARPGLLLIAVYIPARIVGNLLVALGHDSTLLTVSSYLFPQLAMLVLSLHAIHLGMAGRDNDLIEERRIVRVPFVISMGIFVAVVLVSSVDTGQSIADQAPSTEAFVQYRRLFLATYALSVALALNMAFFSLKPGAAALLSNASEAGRRQGRLAKPISKQDLKLLQRLKKAIDEDRLFMQEGLTITALARIISAPEYKLRRLINKQLQFRNFNQYINSYRIREAGRLLAETEEPIANIALATGFSALSSFNKVFKETHGVPPRDFRLMHRGKRGSETHSEESVSDPLFPR